MKSTKNLFLTALTLAALSAGVSAQTASQVTLASNEAHNAASAPAAAAPAAPAPAPSAVTAADVQALKDALAAQQLQIERLTQQLDRQQAQQAAAKAAVEAQPIPQKQVAEIRNDVAVQQDAATPGLNLQDTQTQPSGPPNPLESPVISIHFKGITITPGGFAEAAFVRRSRGLGADLTTPFNSLTLPGASQNSLSEFFGSARQSRPTIYVDGRLKNVEFSSYVSGDFLSAGVTSTATQTNSYTFRLRQAWGQAKFDNGWSFLGGQMWSLVTENKAGIAPSDDLGKTNDARPMTIDPGYNVGFTFARQYGIRLTKDFDHKVAIAVSMENAQGTLTTHGNFDNFLLGEAGASNTYNTTSNYTFNPSPDVIAKISFDPGFGHYEVFGLYDRFRDRIFPCAENFASAACGSLAATSAVQAYNASKNGGAIGANARWNFDNKHIVFGLHGFGGSGIGRYGATQLSDLAINGDGSLHLIKDLQGLATLEWHGKKLDVYAYTGAEYAARTASFDPISNKQVGYGAPLFSNTGCYTETVPVTTGTAGFNPGSLANCTGDTRAAIEGTIGFWYRFYNGPRGKFQFGTQYSYVTRQTWSGVGPAGAGAPGVTPEGLDGMVFTSFRYYLP
ncbi:MAG: hypothetical protein WCA76_07905 [Candidatus Sulfotelmatobacter sp.]|jgi:hypothetical protein